MVRIGTGGHHEYYLPHWFAVAVRLRTLIAAASESDHAAAQAALGLPGRVAGPASGRHLVPVARPARLGRGRLRPRRPVLPRRPAARRRRGSASTRCGPGEGRAAGRGRPEPAVARDPHDRRRARDRAGAPTTGSTGPPRAPTPSSGRSPRSPSCPPTRRSACCSGTSTASSRTPLVTEAAARFPERALRLLAGSTDRAAAALLRVHVLSDPESAQRALATLPPGGGRPGAGGSRRRGGNGRGAARGVAAGAAGPAVDAGAGAVKPVVIAGPTRRAEAAMAWRPGERDAFLAHRVEVHDLAERKRSWAALAAEEFNGPGSGWRELPIMVHAPDEVTRPRLAGWIPRSTGNWRGRRRRSPAGTSSTCCRPCCTGPRGSLGPPADAAAVRVQRGGGDRRRLVRAAEDRPGRSPRPGSRGIRRSPPARWCRRRSARPAPRGARPSGRCG